MKCSKCGKEIANDSNFCEYCGNPIKKSHKKKMWIALAVIFFSYIIIVVLSGALFGNKTVSHVAEVLVGETPEEEAPVAVVDLALPSGTIWYTYNETGAYTYEMAVIQFGTRLPTKEQWEELQSECQWQWTGDGYDIIGNNGNTMTLPATGWRNGDGSVDGVNSFGDYWSSTPNGSEKAWELHFYMGNVGMYNLERGFGRSVRLVQD